MSRSAKRNFLIIGAVVVLCMVAAGLISRFSQPSFPPVGEDARQVRDAHIMPDAPLMFLDGTRGNLRNYAGKIILVHFWASWCVPCIAEFPTLVNLAAKYPDNLVVIAISADENKANIDPFLARFDMTLPPNFLISWDPDKSVIQGVFQTVLYPETIIVSPALKMVDKISGPYEDWTDAQMQEKLAPLLAVAQTNLGE